MKTPLPRIAAISALVALAAACATTLEKTPSSLPALHVAGRELVSGNSTIRLRGLNWGWWHLAATRYTESDMRRQAEWGANAVRLAFSYGDVESAEHDGTLRADGIRDVDDVVRWARRYRQYVVLDMHVAPGGQNPAAYCDGGAGRLWTDPEHQKRFIALWRAIARRYRFEPTVGAYELFNEPVTRQPAPAILADLCRRTIAAIREVDPDKIIIVPGDNWSTADSLTDEIVQRDANLVYTFHFYNGGDRVHWLRNESEGANALSGTLDWTRFEAPLSAGLLDRDFAVLLRSDVNSGTAWFDDVEVVDASGNVVRKFTFDKDTEGFRAEREPVSCITHDAAVGHDSPGSLRIAGTPEYNGGLFSEIRTFGQPQKFVVRGWVKLENATGKTYAAAAMNGIDSAEIDVDGLRAALAPAVAFAERHNVPLLAGEFSCARNAGPEGYQTNSVATRIALFEEHGINWTYWNYRESTHPDGMALHAQDATGRDYPVNEPLLNILKAAFAGKSLQDATLP